MHLAMLQSHVHHFLGSLLQMSINTFTTAPYVLGYLR